MLRLCVKGTFDDAEREALEREIVLVPMYWLVHKNVIVFTKSHEAKVARWYAEVYRGRPGDLLSFAEWPEPKEPSMHLVPAYGRDYKSRKEVEASFDANEDFLISDVSSADCGRYINKEQFSKGASVTVRYAKLTKQCTFTVK